MRLTDLRPARGATKARKRVGRGEGSGHGGTSTKGHKGQKARSGGRPHIWSEGGQMPLVRRIPKTGFKNPNRVEFQVINVDDLNRFEPGADVTPVLLLEKKLARKHMVPVKLLGNGVIDRPVRVRVHAISQTAREKVLAAGGSVELIETLP